MTGRRSPHYGQLMTASLPSEVKTIWYSRDDELDPLPSWRWSFEHQADLEQVEQRELLVKILEATILSDNEAKAIEMVAIGSATFADLAEEIGVANSRAQQIYNNAIRKLRKMQAGFTGIRHGDLLTEIYTWRAYSSIRKAKQ
jgi:DNA-directed RNA polymerase specialized sigma subunit